MDRCCGDYHYLLFGVSDFSLDPGHKSVESVKSGRYVSEIELKNLNNVVNIGKGVFNVPMTLDLLEFYKSKILDSKAIIERSASSYNMYLRDDMYMAYGYPLVGCKVFPNGFNDSYNYLLNVCNSLGV